MNGNNFSQVRANGNEIVRIRYNGFTLWEKYILKIRIDTTRGEGAMGGEELIQFVLSKWFNEDFNYMLVKENYEETSTTLKVDLTIYSDEEPTMINLAGAGFNRPVYNLLNIYNCKNVSKLSLAYLKNTELDIRHLRLDNITDLSALFANCSLESINVSGWDTSKVTSMLSMFSSCTGLTSIDLSTWDTSSVTNTMLMFQNCTSLVSADLRNFDLSNCTNSMMMFMGCTSLTELRLDNCSNDTINKIITSTQFPTFTDGSIHRIYCKQANASGLTAPQGWTFTYVN